MTIPIEHKEEALKLNPQDFYEFFEITLLDTTTIRITPASAKTWNSKLFEKGYVEIKGIGRNAGEQAVRPTLLMENPLAVFHVPISQGKLDGATVTMYRVAPENLNSNPVIFEELNWYIPQVTGLNKRVITAELYGLADRQETLTPPRMFLKPEFSNVTI